MAKIKKATASKKIISPQTETMTCCANNSSSCSHNTNLGKCWMCWLFKSLITLFCAFIVLWVGFCFGILKTQDFKYKIDPALNTMIQKANFCSPLSGSMSRTMSGSSMNMLSDGYASLESKTGADFDREFLIQMITHHESGIEMAKQALEKSENAEILSLAQSIIDAQTAEVEVMQKLNK